MMLPPPCFTVGTMFVDLKASSGRIKAQLSVLTEIRDIEHFLHFSGEF